MNNRILAAFLMIITLALSVGSAAETPLPFSYRTTFEIPERESMNMVRAMPKFHRIVIAPAMKKGLNGDGLPKSGSLKALDNLGLEFKNTSSKEMKTRKCWISFGKVSPQKDPSGCFSN